MPCTLSLRVYSSSPPTVSTTGHNLTVARRAPSLGVWSGQPVFPAPARPKPGTPIVAHIRKDFSYLHLPTNLSIEPPERLPSVEALRRVDHRLFSLFSLEGCDPPSTVSECRTSTTQAGAASRRCHITHELTILLRHATRMGNLTFDEWMPATVVASREAPVALPPSQSRDSPPHTHYGCRRQWCSRVHEGDAFTPEPRSQAARDRQGSDSPWCGSWIWRG